MTIANAGRMALLALLWGSSFLWIKLGLRSFTPIQIVFARLALGAAVLMPIALTRKLPMPRDIKTWGHLAVAGLIANVIPYTLFGIGEQTVGSNIAGMLNATTPLWTVVIASAVGRDQLADRRRAIGVTVGFLGAVMVLEPWKSIQEVTSWGGVACLAAALCYGLSYVYMARYLASREIPPVALSASQLAVAAVLTSVMLPADGLSGGGSLQPEAIVSLAILGVFGTGLAYVINYRMISEVGPTVSSTVTYLLPIVAVVLGAVVLGEPITMTMVVGGALVLIGVARSR